MNTARLHVLILVVGVFLLGSLAPVQAQGAFAHGTVVALQGTPHLWFADEHGVLHWGGDTRALAGKHIAWSNRVEVSLDQLRTLPVGDPWLSAGLLKDGDPIYLVKWETEWELPQLLHIQSIGDVELFGINGSNYGNFVIDRPAWEARYGISAAGLQRGVLASAVSAAPQPATPMPVPVPQPVAPVPTPVPYTGNWEQGESSDPLTNEQTISIVLWSSFDYNYAALGVRCRYGLPTGSRLEVFIAWDTYLDSSRLQVLTRVDEQAVQSDQWTLSTTTNAMFASQPGVRDRLIKDLKQASRLVARVVKQDQTQITAQWNVAGFTVAVKPVEARCGR